ncbi:MAG: hypothetical protein OEN01_06615 [Candidatus Krumholzibacteria bacterium]|nr:hypothetical protein [Candidatus Krumholzibacteria bacterium]
MNFQKWLLLIVAVFLMCCDEQGDDGGKRAVGDGGQSQENSSAHWIEISEEYLEQYKDSDDVTLSSLAESAAQQALSGDSTAPALIQLAKVTAIRCQFDEAVGLLTRAIRESPYQADAWGMLGDAFLESGKYRSADSCYQVMYRLDEGFASLRRIAREKTMFGSFEEAVEYLDRAIAETERGDIADRDVGDAHAQLAQLFFAHGYIEAALESSGRSLVYLPGRARYLALRADILRVSGRPVEAEQIYAKLASLSPHPFYKSMLARFYASRGEHVSADSLVQLAVAGYDKWSVEYFDLIARCYIEFLLDWDIEPERALELAQSEKKKRRDIYVYELLARAYKANQQYDLAWSSISLALRKRTTDPRIVYRASVIAKAAGRDEKYDTFADRSLQLNPLAARIYGAW